MHVWKIVFGILLLTGISGVAFAQTPCYSAPQCAQIRLQYEQYQRAQRDAEAAASAEQARQKHEQHRQQAQDRVDAEVRAQEAAAARARQFAEQQAADEQQKRLALAEAENHAAAQLAAENSPDNHCHDQKTAGDLLTYFNGLQAASDFTSRAVDIDHLTTLKFEPDRHVISCHGSFLLQNGQAAIGTLSTRLNVAGNILTTFHAD
jgi:hypothetical protein